jgi:hypothetical protein
MVQRHKAAGRRVAHDALTDTPTVVGANGIRPFHDRR